MKKALAILLIFTCLVMTMTSCNLFKQKEAEGQTVAPEVDSPEVAADKATIISALSGVKLGEIFADIEDVTLPDEEYVTEAFDQAIEEFKTFKAQGQIEIPDLGTLRGIINDGGMFLYGGNNAEEMELGYALIYTAEAVYAVSQASYGFQLQKTEITTEDVDTSEVEAQVGQYIEMINYYIEIVDGVELPALTSSLITKNGQWYVISSDFMKQVIKSYVVGIATSQGATVTDEDLASMDEALKNVTIDLGFAVNGDKIYGIKLDVNIVSEGQTVAINYEALLNPECTELDKISAGVITGENGMSIILDSDSANETVSLAFDYHMGEQGIQAEAVVAYDAEAEAVESLDIDFAFNMSAQSIEAGATLNFDNIGVAGATVFVLDVDVLVTDSYGTTHGTIDASISNDADCNSVINLVIATDGVENYNIQGNIVYGEAPDAPAADDFVFELVENYDAYEEKAWDVYNAFMPYIEDSVEGYYSYCVTYYDAELGVTIVTDIYIDGYYDYIYDENGDFVGQEFVVITSLDPVEFYVSEGEFAPEYYDFDATVVDGEFVFTAHENVYDDALDNNIPDVGENVEEY